MGNKTIVMGIICLGLGLGTPAKMQAQTAADSKALRTMVSKSLEAGKSYEWLTHITKKIGHRMTGTVACEKAIAYTQQVMKDMGLDSVWLQPVMVPVWVRGDKEEGKMTIGKTKSNISICALGGSVGTGKKGIEAEVILVDGINGMQALSEAQVKGKIVVYTHPMEPGCFTTFEAYGIAVPQRVRGAIAASQKGAIGVLVRSLSHKSDIHPHTGTARYQEGVEPIPCAAISTADMERLEAGIAKGEKVKVWMKMNCEKKPEVLSYNVIGEWRGTEKANEIITIGGHLDSWDMGEGAHDDGAGMVHSLEAVRLLKETHGRTIRTIRVVMFINEEFGLRGADAYLKRAVEETNEKGKKFIVAIESDRGGFAPRGLSFDTTGAFLQSIEERWKPLLEPFGVHQYLGTGGGADIYRMRAKLGTVCIDLVPESHRYFDHHHAETDVLEAVNKRELEMGAGVLASVLYLVGNYGVMDPRLEKR